MISPGLSSTCRVALFSAALGLVAGSTSARGAIVLSSNLASASDGTSAVTGSSYLASSFSTDGSAYLLNSVGLLLQNSSAGKAELDLYSDGGLQPGTLLATLNAPTTYTTTLATNTFTAGTGSAFKLAANTTYWVVLKALGGEFDWSYTGVDTGTGAGFSESWDSSDDAGVSWFNFSSEPNQLSVTATAITSSGAVPEPGSLGLLGLGLLGLLGHRIRDRSRAAG